MLLELSVRNFALVESVNIGFDDGLNILTGETGAGKSIIVGALSFLLGAKTGVEAIRTGAEEAAVQALLHIKEENSEARGWLAANGLEASADGEVAVRRTLRAGGRSAIYIQNTPVTRSGLAEFMAFLFDIHGQHAHENLLRVESHRTYLDRFAGAEAMALEFNAVFQELSAKRKALEAQAAAKHEREEKAELLSFSVDEIDKACVKIGELRELEALAAKLESFEKLSVNIENANEALCGGERAALALLRKFHASLESAASLDGSLSSLEQRAASLFYEADDISGELRAYRDSLEYDSGTVEKTNERLGVLYKLQKKYAPRAEAGCVEEAILAFREKSAEELAAISGAEENREKLVTEIAALEKDIARRAAALTVKRREAASRLSPAIEAILARLGMKGARFEAALAAKGGGDTTATVLGPWGADNVEFLISANAGEPLRPLARIASGGELSRVMLAIKTVLSGADTVETLIFDEIDTGIGGEVAVAVGEYLEKAAKTRQIFCVTHLAAIACRAQRHLRVEKRSEAGRTLTNVTSLSGDGLKLEIARMLSGDSGGAALAHAEEMLRRYGGGGYGKKD